MSGDPTAINGSVAFFYHDNVHLGKNFIDKPFPAGAGLGILERWKRCPFVQYTGIAVCTGTEQEWKGDKNIVRGSDTVRLADRALHYAPFVFTAIETFSIAPGNISNHEQERKNHEQERKHQKQWARRDSNP
jgi:hypothetical protein